LRSFLHALTQKGSKSAFHIFETSLAVQSSFVCEGICMSELSLFGCCT